jgi:hypothetical protein
VEVANPVKRQVHVEEVGDDLVLCRRTGSESARRLAPLGLTFWTVGCVGIAVLVAFEPTADNIILAQPFWSMCLFMAIWLVRVDFGSESLRIGPDGLEYRSRALVPLRERHVPLREIRGIAHYSRVVDGERGRTEHGLMIETLGKPVRFGQGVGRMERPWLAGLLHRHLQALVPDRTIEHRLEGAEEKAVQIEVMRPERAIPKAPSDSKVQSRTDWDRLDVLRRGSFHLAALGVVTFVNLLGNGCVAAFVTQTVKHFHWSLCLFLIPFVIIGLGMFLVWWAVLLDPFRVERWSIGPGEIRTRHSILGMGLSRCYDAEELGWIELRKRARGRELRLTPQGDEADTPYSLGLVGRDGRDRLVIDGLTEGEARWVGGLAYHALKGWLPKDGGSVPPPRDPAASLWDREIDG